LVDSVEEKGLPVLGMAKYIIDNNYNLQPLFDKNGPAFMINTGPIRGRVLALGRLEDINEVLATRGHDFGMAWPGAVSGSL
jgi:hypothetical protein